MTVMISFPSVMDLVARVPDSRVCVFDQHVRYHYADFADAVRRARCSASGLSLKGARVSVLGASGLELALLLSALDGHASLIAVFPPAFDAAQVASFEKQLATSHRAQWSDGRLTCTDMGRASGGADAGPTQWILPTSGTTATPKMVRHTTASLTKSVKTNLERGGTIRWGLLYDLSRLAGLQVFMQSLAGGSAIAIPPQMSDPVRFLPFFERHEVNAVSASPTLWRRIIMDSTESRLPLCQITLGGEIPDDAILRALAHRYPAARITHIYASTELGFGFSVTDGQAGFPADYLRKPLAGMELKIGPHGTLLARTSRRGFYVTAESGTDDEWFDSGDRVEQRGDRVFFLGRDSGAINVGGNKVHPEEVEAVALEVPGVSAARASGRRNSMIGYLVQLEIALQPGAEPVVVKEAVQARCQSDLPPFKRPAIIKIVADIPMTPTGKIKRSERDA
jgi:acyl-CoA synthetase (AMP-forming)/AMP-acid ligase II